MVAIWFVLGCLIDSISIILLTVPIFAPIATALGFDPLAFAIMGILAIETGLLTPPFGILVFTVKSAVPDPDVTLAEIFRGSIPYWIVLLALVALLAVFPQLATFLPKFLAGRNPRHTFYAFPSRICGCLLQCGGMNLATASRALDAPFQLWPLLAYSKPDRSAILLVSL